jgi:hypothetical protein
MVTRTRLNVASAYFPTNCEQHNAKWRVGVWGIESGQPGAKPCFANAAISKGTVCNKFPGGARVSNLELMSALWTFNLMLALNRSTVKRE